MTEPIEKIQILPERALREIMSAIEQRYAASYPDWDIFYIAVHKNPELKKQELASIKKMLAIDESNL